MRRSESRARQAASRLMKRQAITAGTSLTTIDWRAGDYCIITLTADTVLAFSPLPPRGFVVPLTLLVVQDGTGNRSLTFQPVTSGFATLRGETTNQPDIYQEAGSRTELQAVLDAESDVLRVRQGVLGEQVFT